jgi:hypothetical protein
VTSTGSPTNWSFTYDDNGNMVERNSTSQYDFLYDAENRLVRASAGGLEGVPQESGGMVVIEAEKYWNKIGRSSHDWALSTAKADYSGTGAMVANPNNGGFYDTSYTTTSPEMRFLVDIRQPGTYYVWIRAWADSGTDDSAHIGLDDQAVTSADRIYPNTLGAWVWTKLTMDGPYVATLNVTTPGVHAVNIWAREDGLYIDKIVLTTNSSYTPSGTGPNVSVRGPVYVYDGDGNRVKAVEAGKITAYLGSHYEVEVSGGITTTRSYYYAGSQRLAMRLNK